MAVKLAKRNKRAGQKISRGLEISRAMYRSTVDNKVRENVGLSFVLANFPSSRDFSFVAAECRLVGASISITVIAVQNG